MSCIDSRESEIPEGPKALGEINSQLSVQAFSNPSTAYFMVTIRSSSTSHSMSFWVIDAAGRIVEQKAGISADQIFQLGARYQPGVYFIKVMQDGQTRQLKLLKLKQ